LFLKISHHSQIARNEPQLLTDGFSDRTRLDPPLFGDSQVCLARLLTISARFGQNDSKRGMKHVNLIAGIDLSVDIKKTPVFHTIENENDAFLLLSDASEIDAGFLFFEHTPRIEQDKKHPYIYQPVYVLLTEYMDGDQTYQTRLPINGTGIHSPFTSSFVHR
jgi:hypothetical protein